MSFFDGLGLGMILVWISLLVAMIIGWVMNIVTLIKGGYETMIEVIVSIIGIFVAPVGALMYYIVG